jgi:hypothetical protein
VTERSEGGGPVDGILLHQIEQRLHEFAIAVLGAMQPDLPSQPGQPVLLEPRGKIDHHLVGRLDRLLDIVVDQRQQRFGQARQVPLRDAGLVLVLVAPAPVDRTEDGGRIIGVHERAGPEIDRLA